MKLRYKIGIGFLAVLTVAVLSLAYTLSYTQDCEPATAEETAVETFKAVRYRCYGSPDVLEFTDVPTPEPGGKEVLVKIKAAAVNPLDWHYMRGSPYFMRLGSGLGAPEDPRLGVDFAGVVEAVGSEVTRFEPGDEVFGGSSGAFAQYLVVPESRGIVHKPADISFEQAAAVPVAALTALQALRDKGGLEPGQKVLINGASGGVGTYAVQIAKSMGAEVHGVCSTRNVEMVRSIGADHVWDYKKENYTESDERYDLIIDNVGNHSLLRNRKVMKPGGRLVIVGGKGGDWLGPLMRPLGAMIISPFVDQEFVMFLARLKQDDLEVMASLLQEGKVKSVIDQRFPFAEVPDAIRYSEAGRARGKIIVNVD